MPRVKKRPESWTGQVGMDVGEQKRRVEPESSVLKRVTEALELALGEGAVFRNSVGLARHGQRRVRYGLEKGSADLICIVAPHGRLLSVECKRGKGGTIEPEQIAWAEKVRAMGGVAGFARSPEEALALVEEARKARAA